ncbi:GGDEF domain-containing response regulator [bacterium]|nr:GGDEF domain-containing response regulator [bacterium]
MEQERIKVLILEKDGGVCNNLSEILLQQSQVPFEVRIVDRLEEAIPFVDRFQPDVILSDLLLPDSTGMATFERIYDHAPDIPVIILSAHNDDQLAQEALQSGARDLIVKGTRDRVKVIRAIKNAIEVSHLSQSLASEEQSENELPYRDPLTGLPSRVLFQDRLQTALIQSARSGNEIGVLSLDLDGFRRINEKVGREVGDLLLLETAQRLKAAVRASDTVARLGGDEFNIILFGINRQEDAALVARKILRAINKGFLIGGQRFFLTASIGVSVYPHDGKQAKYLVESADLAKYEAKRGGKNHYKLHNQAFSTAFKNALSLERGLRVALDRGEFVAFFQPQVELLTGKITGLEALVRWQHPECGLIQPSNFMSAAMETGIIAPIDELILRTACQQTKLLQGYGFSNLRAAVNLSTIQFRKRSLPDIVINILQETGLQPSHLCLEVTEVDVMQDAEHAIDLLRVLKDLGVQLTVDDFGRGGSSLNHIKRFPIDMLKVDRSFIKGLPTDVSDKATTTAIIAVAHSLGLKVLAKGLETVEQFDFLKGLHCDEMQGFYFSRPLRSEFLLHFLEESKRLA